MMVRAEGPADHAPIRRVHEQGFGPGSVEAALVEALRAAGAHVPDLCLVAIEGEEIVGHPGYYPRFGFEPAGALGLRAPFEVPAEAWMALRLPAYTPAARGLVTYAEAFGDV